MKKIQYSVYRRETGDAGGKAKNDASDILQKYGFEQSYNPNDKRIIRILQQFFSMHRFGKDTILIVQYPAVHEKVFPMLKKQLKKVKYSIAIIHDIRSLQGLGGDPKKEMDSLNCFNCLIVHNEKMEQYLKENDYAGKIVKLNLFDYLHDISAPILPPKYDGSICVAGNLDKSPYLEKISEVNRTFNLYGINNTIDFSAIGNANYCGLLSSEEIVYKLDADYGLVWDGDSINACSGKRGNYLKYNNPHKMSLYLAAGKPVIIWKQSAVAKFVMDNNIGIVVDSLLELNDIAFEKEKYDLMRSNVLNIKNAIGEGLFLMAALEEALSEII